MRDEVEPVVLDASAVLAYLQKEAGGEEVRREIAAGAWISSVNLSEVYVKLAAQGVDFEASGARLIALGLQPLPFSEEDALLSARLYPRTRPSGLSFGARACLSLARRLERPALTADRAWAKLSLGVEVRVIR